MNQPITPAVVGAVPITRSVPGIESVVRLLIHARNSHGAQRQCTRALIHADLNLLRGLHHG